MNDCFIEQSSTCYKGFASTLDILFDSAWSLCKLAIFKRLFTECRYVYGSSWGDGY